MGFMDDLGWHIYAPYNSYVLINVNVTHWMELPDFPNEKDKNG